MAQTIERRARGAIPQPAERSPNGAVAREESVRQYSLAQILGVWAAAAGPMGLLAWVGAPLLRDQLSGPEPMARALLLLLTAGLVWQFLLVLILVGREQRSLRWSRIREALWLRRPRDPKSGRVGGRVWLWFIPFFLIFALEQFIPAIPGPAARDFAKFMDTGGGEEFFKGAWVWFGVVVALSIFNTILGEELLFRGVLLPRMRGVFGRWDWLANGIMFATYHLHVPWVIPTALVDSLALAYPSRRFRSAWMGIIVHSTQSVFFILIVLVAVLG